MSVRPESPAWQRIEALIVSGDHNALALAVDDLDDAERPAVARSLRSFASADPDVPLAYSTRGSTLAIVGAGVLPDAKSTATWLSRHSITYYVRDASGVRYREEKDIVPQLLFVLTRRNVDWLPALVTELARRMTRTVGYFSGARFDLVNRLLAITGQQPPTDDGFVVAWTVRTRTRDEVITALRADPRLAALVPRMFELDEVGAWFDANTELWPATLAEAAAFGLVGRDVVLDACVARLGRKGKPGATRAYARVLEALAPTAAEKAERADGFEAMLSAPLSTVAAMAQQVLFELDDAGVLPLDAVLSTARTALARSEKKLVRAQLTRLAQADATRAESVAGVIVAALPHLAPDLARTAVTALRTLAAALTANQRAELLTSVGALARDLAAELGAALGTSASVSVEAPSPRTNEPPPWRPQRLDPISDLTQLVAETALLFDWSVELDPRRLELVLEGLIEWHRRDRTALRGALRRVIDSERFQRTAALYDSYHDNYDFGHGMAAVVAAAAAEPPIVVGPGSDHRRTVGDVVVDRLLALADAMQTSSPGVAISRPTWDSGLIDPDDLVERLARAAREGVEPWEIELEQALLRLSLPSEPRARSSLADMFAALGSDAARVAATWVSARLPADPLLETIVVPSQYIDYSGQVIGEWERILVSVRPAGTPGPTSVIWQGVTQLDAHTPRWGHDYSHAQACIPWLAPRHRDLIAAHLLPTSGTWRNNRQVSSLLPALAALDGGFGDATALALVYGFASDLAGAPEHAVQATITLCARRILDTTVLGRVLADLSTHRSVVMKRLVDPLRAAADGGAARQVWDVLLVALPVLMRTQPSLTGLADVLGLAAEIAERVDARGRVDGLDDFAGRRGNSRQLVEARRLQGLLTT